MPRGVENICEGNKQATATKEDFMSSATSEANSYDVQAATKVDSIASAASQTQDIEMRGAWIWRISPFSAYRRSESIEESFAFLVCFVLDARRPFRPFIACVEVLGLRH